MRQALPLATYITTAIVTGVLMLWGIILVQAHLEIRSQVYELTRDWDTNWGYSGIADPSDNNQKNNLSKNSVDTRSKPGEERSAIHLTANSVALTDGQNIISTR